MRFERGDFISFLHGIINLAWPVVAYDLAELASLIIWGYSQMAAVPVTIMLLLPILSDVVCIVIAGIRNKKKGKHNKKDMQKASIL